MCVVPISRMYIVSVIQTMTYFVEIATRIENPIYENTKRNQLLGTTGVWSLTRGTCVDPPQPSARSQL